MRRTAAHPGYMTCFSSRATSQTSKGLSMTGVILTTALLMTVATAPTAAAQTAAAQTPPAAAQQIDRIRQALTQVPALDLNDQQLRFYLEIIAKQPKFSDFVKGYDFINGPTKGGNPMSHDEFVKLVTPREHYGTAGIQPIETLQFALTNWLAQALIKRALEEVRQAKTEREMQEIRDRVDHELAVLRGDASNSQ
jgi:hypothetical protein